MRERRADPVTVGMYVALGVAALLSLCLPLSGALARRFLANHHLRPTSTASWATVNLLPKMYGGRHEVWVATEPVTEFFTREPDRAPFDMVHAWVNHYPGRYLRLDTGRAALVEAGRPAYVRIESSYRGVVFTSSYVVRPSGGRLEARRGP